MLLPKKDDSAVCVVWLRNKVISFTFKPTTFYHFYKVTNNSGKLVTITSSYSKNLQSHLGLGENKYFLITFLYNPTPVVIISWCPCVSVCIGKSLPRLMQPQLLMFNKIWTEIFSTPENYEVYWIDLCTTSRIGNKLLQI